MPINRRKFIVGTGTFAIASKAWGQPQVRLGIILVGVSWCPYCKNAAAILIHAGPALDIPVLVVSKDNKPIAPFETFISGDNHPIAEQIVTVPTTLFYQPDEDRIVDLIEGFRNPRSYIARLKSAVKTAIEAGYVG